MEVTVDSDTLFEAYDAAESDDTRAILRETLVEARPRQRGIAAMYPHVAQRLEIEDTDVDADEIVEELEDDEDEQDDPSTIMSVEEARDHFNEQATDTGLGLGAVITPVGQDNDLYVSAIGSDADIREVVDHFDTPEGWTAFAVEDRGVAFNRAEAVFAPHGSRRPNAVDQFSDCHHSVIDGTHSVWAYEGTDEARRLRKGRTTTVTPDSDRDITVEDLRDGIVTDDE